MYCVRLLQICSFCFYVIVHGVPIEFEELDNVINEDDTFSTKTSPTTANTTLTKPPKKNANVSQDLTVKRQIILPGNPFFVEPIPNLDLPDVLPTLDLETKDTPVKNTTTKIKIDRNGPTATNITKLIEQIEEFIANQEKIAKQEVEGMEEFEGTTEREVSANQDEENEEESEESEEEPSDFVQALIKSFLGQLSTPEGGVDVDAIVGLIGGLSVPNDDGTYDFSGLTETLQSFLDPGEDGMGGSDVGAFLGGLIGAFIQGVARPPGAKGSGILAGNLVARILPGLSAPAPPPEGTEMPQKKPTLDIGSFLGGFLKAFLGASSGGNNGNDKNGWKNPFASIKQTLFKSVFSGISSLLVKPSGASSKSGWK